MARKTELIYASSAFDGTDGFHAAESIKVAIDKLIDVAAAQEREALLDTLEVQIRRESADMTSIAGDSKTIATVVSVDVSALAVLRG